MGTYAGCRTQCACLLSFVLIKAVTDKIESDLHQIEPKIALTNGALSFGEALLSESKKNIWGVKKKKSRRDFANKEILNVQQ